MEHSLRLLIGALRIEKETFREYSKLKGKGSAYFRKAAREAAKKIPDYQAAIKKLQSNNQTSIKNENNTNKRKGN